ncbi:hypothetical protein QL285_071506 [Trifolium repens]|nr:hypothetical protein QL285_071506 [Trifolium repens]
MSFPLFNVLLSYIDSRQYLRFMSCYPTLIADIVFYSSPCSLALTADNVFFSCVSFSCSHSKQYYSFILWLYSLTLIVANVSSFYVF